MGLENFDVNKNFSNMKCSICNGFGTVKHGALICPTCKGHKVIIIDKNGKIIDQDWVMPEEVPTGNVF